MNVFPSDHAGWLGVPAWLELWKRPRSVPLLAGTGSDSLQTIRRLLAALLCTADSGAEEGFEKLLDMLVHVSISTTEADIEHQTAQIALEWSVCALRDTGGLSGAGLSSKNVDLQGNRHSYGSSGCLPFLCFRSSRVAPADNDQPYAVSLPQMRAWCAAAIPSCGLRPVCESTSGPPGCGPSVLGAVKGRLVLSRDAAAPQSLCHSAAGVSIGELVMVLTAACGRAFDVFVMRDPGGGGGKGGLQSVIGETVCALDAGEADKPLRLLQRAHAAASVSSAVTTDLTDDPLTFTLERACGCAFGMSVAAAAGIGTASIAGPAPAESLRPFFSSCYAPLLAPFGLLDAQRARALRSLAAVASGLRAAAAAMAACDGVTLVPPAGSAVLTTAAGCRWLGEAASLAIAVARADPATVPSGVALASSAPRVSVAVARLLSACWHGDAAASLPGGGVPTTFTLALLHVLCGGAVRLEGGGGSESGVVGNGGVGGNVLTLPQLCLFLDSAAVSALAHNALVAELNAARSAGARGGGAASPVQQRLRVRVSRRPECALEGVTAALASQHALPVFSPPASPQPAAVASAAMAGGTARMLHPAFAVDAGSTYLEVEALLLRPSGSAPPSGTSEAPRQKQQQQAQDIEAGEGHGPRKELLQLVAAAASAGYTAWITLAELGLRAYGAPGMPVTPQSSVYVTAADASDKQATAERLSRLLRGSMLRSLAPAADGGSAYAEAAVLSSRPRKSPLAGLPGSGDVVAVDLDDALLLQAAYRPAPGDDASCCFAADPSALQIRFALSPLFSSPSSWPRAAVFGTVLGSRVRRACIPTGSILPARDHLYLDVGWMAAAALVNRCSFGPALLLSTYTVAGMLGCGASLLRMADAEERHPEVLEALLGMYAMDAASFAALLEADGVEAVLDARSGAVLVAERDGSSGGGGGGVKPLASSKLPVRHAYAARQLASVQEANARQESCLCDGFAAGLGRAGTRLLLTGLRLHPAQVRGAIAGDVPVAAADAGAGVVPTQSVLSFFRLVFDDELRACPAMQAALQETVASWTGERQARFLHFVTGVAEVPPAGTEVMRIETLSVPEAAAAGRVGRGRAVGPSGASGSDPVLQRYPQAHSCSNTLELPNYYAAHAKAAGPGADAAARARASVEESLWAAITMSAGYGLDATAAAAAGPGHPRAL